MDQKNDQVVYLFLIHAFILEDNEIKCRKLYYYLSAEFVIFIRRNI